MKKVTVNVSDERYEEIKKAAEFVGLTVPAFMRLKSIEAANKGETNG